MMNNPNYQEASKNSSYVEDQNSHFMYLQYPDNEIAKCHPVQFVTLDEERMKFVEEQPKSDKKRSKTSSVLTQLPSIEHSHFRFQNSGLKAFPEGMPYPASPFELDLSHNYLRFLYNKEWTEKPSHFNCRIVSLDLSNNFLGTVHLSNFERFENLTNLNLSMNVLTEINGFENLPQLKRLFLHSNLIKSLWKSISALKKLEVLSLDWPNILYCNYDKVLYRKSYLDSNPHLMNGRKKLQLSRLLGKIEKNPNAVYTLDDFQKDYGKTHRQSNLAVELPWALDYGNVLKIDLILEDNPMLLSLEEYCGINLMKEKNRLVEMDRARELYTVLNKSDCTKRIHSN